VGKTFIAQALGVQICRQRRRVVFTKTNAFLADLAGGRAEGNWQTRLRRYLTPDLVILDHFAMREYTLTQAEDLYELVKGRYRRGSLTLTSNRNPRISTSCSRPVMAAGLLDRLLNSAYVITMLGRSYRPQQRPGSSSNRTSTSGGDPQVPNYREQMTGNKR
jgi:DNA replication protein DnaC